MSSKAQVQREKVFFTLSSLWKINLFLQMFLCYNIMYELEIRVGKSMESSIPMTFGDKIKSDFSFSRMIGDKEYAVDEHWHDCFEIILVEAGRFKVVLEGTEHILTEGDIVIIPPRILHSTEAMDGYREICVFGYVENLIYSPDLSLINMKYLAPFRYGAGVKYLVLKSDSGKTEGLCRLLIDAMRSYEQDGFERELRIRSKILEIHAQVCSLYLLENTHAYMQDGYLAEAQLYIEKHIGEDISPYDIADAIHLSYSHLCRLIRNAYGCTLSVLILRMKLNYAERLMTDDTSISITEIALQSGFNSASYFTRCFRRMKGISPQKFRSMLNHTNV